MLKPDKINFCDVTSIRFCYAFKDDIQEFLCTHHQLLPLCAKPLCHVKLEQKDFKIFFISINSCHLVPCYVLPSSPITTTGKSQDNKLEINYVNYMQDPGQMRTLCYTFICNLRLKTSI